MTELVSIQWAAIAAKALAAVGILLFGIVAARIADRALKESFTRAKLDVTLGKFLSRGAKYGIYAFALLTALSTLGVNIQPILAGIGVAGFIVGFAVKDTLSNLSAGLLLIFYRPFEVGDMVTAGGVRGRVKEINIVATIVETQEASTVTVPNSKVWGAPITRFSS
jgi:small conductance mechanosensitive channel